MLTLDAFRARFPWPEASLALGAPLEWLWHYDLDASLDALWLQLADTSRFNRALGEPEMKLSERDGRLHGEVSYAGLRYAWVDEPWSWAAGSYLCCVRNFSRGLGRQVRCIYWFEPLDAVRAARQIHDHFSPAQQER